MPHINTIFQNANFWSTCFHIRPGANCGVRLSMLLSSDDVELIMFIDDVCVVVGNKRKSKSVTIIIIIIIK